MASPRFMKMTWPTLETDVRVRFLDDQAPTICNLLWNALPYESVQGHALISGCMIFATSPIFTLARENVRQFVDMGIGACAYGAGSQNVVVAYGFLTEPEGISIWGQVPEEDWPTLRRVGRRAWENMIAPYGDLSLNPIAKQIILVHYEKV